MKAKHIQEYLILAITYGDEVIIWDLDCMNKWAKVLYKLICTKDCSEDVNIEGKVYPKINICWKSTHPRAIHNVDDLFLYQNRFGEI